MQKIEAVIQPQKLDAVKARQPNPFVVGPSTVQRFLTVVGECAKAQIATF